MSISDSYASTQPIQPTITIEKRKLLVGASILALLLGIGGYFGYQWGINKHRSLRNQVSELQKNNEALKDYATGTEYGISSVRDDLERSKSSLGRIKILASTLQTKVKKLMDTDSSGNYAIDVASIDVSDATHELESGLQDLDRRLAEFDERLGKWEKKASQPPSASPAQTESQPQKKEQTVYITRTGSKYHRAGCQYLSRSQIPIKKSDAIDRGYTACSRCNP